MSIFTFEKLYKAYKECQKGKKNTTNALNFEINKEKNILKLLDELKSHEYEISRYVYFISTNPVPREIFAADFRDRIVHHLLYNEIYDIFESLFISDSYANRKGKGTHNAVYKLRQNIQKLKYEKNNSFYLKLDVQSFFRSINKDILYRLIEKVINERNKDDNFLEWRCDILWLVRKIIFHKPTDNYIYKGKLKLQRLIPKNKSLFYSGDLGLPIGNLTSQFFANIYLNELDHFLKNELKVEKYIRYVDDFIILDTDLHKLKSFIPQIDNFLNKKLGLRLHPNKINLQNIEKGIDFLGYFVKPTHTLVRQKVVKRFKNKLYKRRNPDDGFFSLSDIPMIKSYLGHFSHANSFNLRKKLGS